MNRALFDKLKTRIEELENLVNGGPGSGNFGHVGRPGLVGGSGGKGTGSSTPKSEKEWADKTDIELEKSYDENDEGEPAYEEDIERLSAKYGFAREEDEDEMYESLSIETCRALEEGLEEAKTWSDDGYSDLGLFSDIKLKVMEKEETRNIATMNTRGEMGLSVSFLKDGQNYQDTLRVQCDRTQYHTSPDLKGVVRHELGHAFCNEVFGDTNKEDFLAGVWKKVVGKELKDVPYKEMSIYGHTNYSEAVAECFSNPDYSKTTRKMFDFITDSYEMRKFYDEYEDSLYSNEAGNKTRNEAGEDEAKPLCIGYFMTEEDMNRALKQKEQEEKNMKREVVQKISNRIDELAAIVNGGAGLDND